VDLSAWVLRWGDFGIKWDGGALVLSPRQVVPGRLWFYDERDSDDGGLGLRKVYAGSAGHHVLVTLVRREGKAHENE